MSFSELPTIARFRVDSLEVFVYENRALAGRAAALGIAQAIRSRQRAQGIANIVFAAAPSQNEFLAGLVAATEIDWSRVALSTWTSTWGSTPITRFRSGVTCRSTCSGWWVWGRTAQADPGEQVERPLQTCLDYEDVLLAKPTDIVCAGIGENGHLAFNDPPVADFLDPVLVKVVRLDAACRNQQLNDGCFERLADVPTHAYTLTIPALLRAGGLGRRTRPAQGQRGLDHPARADQRVVPRHGAAPPPRGEALPRPRVGPARALTARWNRLRGAFSRSCKTTQETGRRCGCSRRSIRRSANSSAAFRRSARHPRRPRPVRRAVASGNIHSSRFRGVLTES